MAKARTKGRPLAAAFIPVPDYQPPAAPRATNRADTASWYAIRNATADDEAELLLYDEIGGWFGTWADEFIEGLKQITAPRLRVRVNSPGGSVFEGIALANALRAHPANVTVQVDGIAASIASVIAMAGDRVEMGPQSTLMIHDASGLCVGDATEMTKMAEVLDMLSDNIADAYADKAGGTRAQWRDRMRAETWYLANEAVTAGLADVVLPSRHARDDDAPDDDPMAKQWDLSGFRYAGREDAPAPAAAAPEQPAEPNARPEEPAMQTVLDIKAPEGLNPELVAFLADCFEAAQKATPGVGPEPVTVPTEQPAAPERAAPEQPEAPPAPETPAQPDDPAPDGWADQTAHLLADPVPEDDWAQLVAQLTDEPLTPSHSAATA